MCLGEIYQIKLKYEAPRFIFVTNIFDIYSVVDILKYPDILKISERTNISSSPYLCQRICM